MFDVRRTDSQIQVMVIVSAFDAELFKFIKTAMPVCH